LSLPPHAVSAAKAQRIKSFFMVDVSEARFPALAVFRQEKAAVDSSGRTR
jgi:hypothetical protein